MHNSKRVAVVIAAAGSGKRLGGRTPKQYLAIGGQPMIVKTLKLFESIRQVDDIFIVANEAYIDHCQKLACDYGLCKVASIVSGGQERQDSVYRALVEIERKRPETAYVLIHDGARPFVSEAVVQDVVNAAAESGAAVPCVPLKDSLRYVGGAGNPGGAFKLEGAQSLDCAECLNGAERLAYMENTGGTESLGCREHSGGAGRLDRMESRSVDRSRYFSVQTPQGFRMPLLTEAYRKAMQQGYYGTDDASIAEWAGYQVKIVQGDYRNIKITTKEDLPMETRVGTGFDVHRFEKGRDLILGGVTIPYEQGLLGHSDADVLVHALMDALLGAAALGDIGRHFPDTEAQYKGISSLVLLEKVAALLCENFYSIGNVDVTVIAQAPKLSPYIGEMCSNLSRVLKLGTDKINIKATTTERLGFTGRKEGIAAEAVCSIYR